MNFKPKKLSAPPDKVIQLFAGILNPNRNSTASFGFKWTVA